MRSVRIFSVRYCCKVSTNGYSVGSVEKSRRVKIRSRSRKVNVGTMTPSATSRSVMFNSRRTCRVRAWIAAPENRWRLPPACPVPGRHDPLGAGSRSAPGPSGRHPQQRLRLPWAASLLLRIASGLVVSGDYFPTSVIRSARVRIRLWTVRMVSRGSAARWAHDHDLASAVHSRGVATSAHAARDVDRRLATCAVHWRIRTSPCAAEIGRGVRSKRISGQRISYGLYLRPDGVAIMDPQVTETEFACKLISIRSKKSFA